MTYRYPLDPAGNSPNNRVMDEIHDLPSSPTRVLAPRNGAFFTESLVVFDEATGRPLIKGAQYKTSELLHEATLHYAKEICLLVLILDQNVSSRVRIQYQVLGGPLNQNAEGIRNLYASLVNDTRTVDWVDVTNKAAEYPPTLHQHVMEDIYRFGPVVNALERVRHAILIGNTPAYNHLIDWVNSRFEQLPIASLDDMDNGIPDNKLITKRTLYYTYVKGQSIRMYVAEVDTVLQTSDGTYSLVVDITTTDAANNVPLYYKVEQVSGPSVVITNPVMPVSIANNAGTFTVEVQGASPHGVVLSVKLLNAPDDNTDLNAGRTLVALSDYIEEDAMMVATAPCERQYFIGAISSDRLSLLYNSNFSNRGK